MAKEQIVERLVDAVRRGHISPAQYQKLIASGYKTGATVTVYVEKDEEA